MQMKLRICTCDVYIYHCPHKEQGVIIILSLYTHYQTSIDNYKYAFFTRTVPDWNNLPVHII